MSSSSSQPSTPLTADHAVHFTSLSAPDIRRPLLPAGDDFSDGARHTGNNAAVSVLNRSSSIFCSSVHHLNCKCHLLNMLSIIIIVTKLLLLLLLLLHHHRMVAVFLAEAVMQIL
jgi:hypothetical protein